MSPLNSTSSIAVFNSKLANLDSKKAIEQTAQKNHIKGKDVKNLNLHKNAAFNSHFLKFLQNIHRLNAAFEYPKHSAQPFLPVYHSTLQSIQNYIAETVGYPFPGYHIHLCNKELFLFLKKARMEYFPLFEALFQKGTSVFYNLTSLWCIENLLKAFPELGDWAACLDVTHIDKKPQDNDLEIVLPQAPSNQSENEFQTLISLLCYDGSKNLQNAFVELLIYCHLRKLSFQISSHGNTPVIIQGFDKLVRYLQMAEHPVQSILFPEIPFPFMRNVKIHNPAIFHEAVLKLKFPIDTTSSPPPYIQAMYLNDLACQFVFQTSHQDMRDYICQKGHAFKVFHHKFESGHGKIYQEWDRVGFQSELCAYDLTFFSHMERRMIIHRAQDLRLNWLPLLEGLEELQVQGSFQALIDRVFKIYRIVNIEDADHKSWAHYWKEISAGWIGVSESDESLLAEKLISHCKGLGNAVHSPPLHIQEKQPGSLAQKTYETLISCWTKNQNDTPQYPDDSISEEFAFYFNASMHLPASAFDSAALKELWRKLKWAFKSPLPPLFQKIANLLSETDIDFKHLYAFLHIAAFRWLASSEEAQKETSWQVCIDRHNGRPVMRIIHEKAQLLAAMDLPSALASLNSADPKTLKLLEEFSKVFEFPASINLSPSNDLIKMIELVELPQDTLKNTAMEILKSSCPLASLHGFYLLKAWALITSTEASLVLLLTLFSRIFPQFSDPGDKEECISMLIGALEPLLAGLNQNDEKRARENFMKLKKFPFDYKKFTGFLLIIPLSVFQKSALILWKDRHELFNDQDFEILLKKAKDCAFKLYSNDPSQLNTFRLEKLVESALEEKIPHNKNLYILELVSLIKSRPIFRESVDKKIAAWISNLSIRELFAFIKTYEETPFLNPEANWMDIWLGHYKTHLAKEPLIDLLSLWKEGMSLKCWNRSDLWKNTPFLISFLSHLFLSQRPEALNLADRLMSEWKTQPAFKPDEAALAEIHAAHLKTFLSKIHSDNALKELKNPERSNCPDPSYSIALDKSLSMLLKNTFGAPPFSSLLQMDLMETLTAFLMWQKVLPRTSDSRIWLESNASLLFDFFELPEQADALLSLFTALEMHLISTLKTPRHLEKILWAIDNRDCFDDRQIHCIKAILNYSSNLNESSSPAVFDHGKRIMEACIAHQRPIEASSLAIKILLPIARQNPLLFNSIRSHISDFAAFFSLDDKTHHLSYFYLQILLQDLKIASIEVLTLFLSLKNLESNKRIEFLLSLLPSLSTPPSAETIRSIILDFLELKSTDDTYLQQMLKLAEISRTIDQECWTMLLAKMKACNSIVLKNETLCRVSEIYSSIDFKTDMLRILIFEILLDLYFHFNNCHYRDEILKFEHSYGPFDSDESLYTCLISFFNKWNRFKKPSLDSLLEGKIVSLYLSLLPFFENTANQGKKSSLIQQILPCLFISLDDHHLLLAAQLLQDLLKEDYKTQKLPYPLFKSLLRLWNNAHLLSPPPTIPEVPGVLLQCTELYLHSHLEENECVSLMHAVLDHPSESALKLVLSSTKIRLNLKRTHSGQKNEEERFYSKLIFSLLNHTENVEFLKEANFLQSHPKIRDVLSENQIMKIFEKWTEAVACLYFCSPKGISGTSYDLWNQISAFTQRYFIPINSFEHTMEMLNASSITFMKNWVEQEKIPSVLSISTFSEKNFVQSCIFSFYTSLALNNLPLAPLTPEIFRNNFSAISENISLKSTLPEYKFQLPPKDLFYQSLIFIKTLQKILTHQSVNPTVSFILLNLLWRLNINLLIRFPLKAKEIVPLINSFILSPMPELYPEQKLHMFLKCHQGMLYFFSNVLHKTSLSKGFPELMNKIYLLTTNEIPLHLNSDSKKKKEATLSFIKELSLCKSYILLEKASEIYCEFILNTSEKFEPEILDMLDFFLERISHLPLLRHKTHHAIWVISCIYSKISNSLPKQSIAIRNRIWQTFAALYLKHLKIDAEDPSQLEILTSRHYTNFFQHCFEYLKAPIDDSRFDIIYSVDYIRILNELFKTTKETLVMLERIENPAENFIALVKFAHLTIQTCLKEILFNLQLSEDVAKENKTGTSEKQIM